MKDKATYISAFLISALLHGYLLFGESQLFGAGRKDREVITATMRFHKTPERPKPEEIPLSKPEKRKKPKPVVSQEPVVEEIVEPVEPVEMAAVAEGPSPDEIKRMYMEEIMSCIEKCKFYPGAARKRGIDGDVSVKISLNEKGEVDDVEVDGEHHVLCMAAKDAVKKAAPFPAPPPGVDVGRLNFIMEYSLK